MKGRALVAWNLRRIRVRRGLSQERLAFDARVDRSYVGGLERREENPTVDVLDRLAKTLCVLCRTSKRFAGAEAAAQKRSAVRTVAFHRLCRRLRGRCARIHACSDRQPSERGPTAGVAGYRASGARDAYGAARR